ncbi:MAG: hypothetical protein AW10_02822 [Candidatus Accumulibacter appositus]|mgnify:CR=1 FL=1|uniref:Uncharacterized protein n=1 Tax=Candidatus Accumulibacter appositus TaxID=1454003 RepID=A0A011N7T4_9PROT|nr:MAG: hypothetical protein AW10_02822 [Candidatus Accumulibacter appositus]
MVTVATHVAQHLAAGGHRHVFLLSLSTPHTGQAFAKQ